MISVCHFDITDIKSITHMITYKLHWKQKQQEDGLIGRLYQTQILLHFTKIVYSIFYYKTVKYGRDRMGGDHKRCYVLWPQEACFIGPDQVCVRYDEWSHPQWSAAAIAFQETDVHKQQNMIAYMAAIQQDVVDNGYSAGPSAHAVVVLAIEEGRAWWEYGINHIFTTKLFIKSQAQNEGNNKFSAWNKQTNWPSTAARSA